MPFILEQQEARRLGVLGRSKVHPCRRCELMMVQTMGYVGRSVHLGDLVFGAEELEVSGIVGEGIVVERRAAQRHPLVAELR